MTDKMKQFNVIYRKLKPWAKRDPEFWIKQDALDIIKLTMFTHDRLNVIRLLLKKRLSDYYFERNRDIIINIVMRVLDP